MNRLFRLAFATALFACLSQSGFGQSMCLDRLLVEENVFYLACRGTKSKAGLIAEKFNLTDPCSTHVGIGIMADGKLQIYNVTNEHSGGQSALVMDSVESFTGLPDATYFCLWRCRVSSEKIEKLKAILLDYEKKSIAFDFDFDAATDDKLYCSEFCAKVLCELDAVKFNFPLSEIALDSFYSMALKRKTLKYWPVDFFEQTGQFGKIYEIYFDE